SLRRRRSYRARRRRTAPGSAQEAARQPTSRRRPRGQKDRAVTGGVASGGERRHDHLLVDEGYSTVHVPSRVSSAPRSATLRPKSSGLPCSRCSCASGAAVFAVKLLNTPSLKTTQFWNTSTNDAPLCACARFSNATRSACWVSTARPTNRPPVPRANAHGDTGFSTE